MIKLQEVKTTWEFVVYLSLMRSHSSNLSKGVKGKELPLKTSGYDIRRKPREKLSVDGLMG